MELITDLSGKREQVITEKEFVDKFFTVGQVLRGIWRGEVTFTIPNPILMHHAAGTFGMEDKIKLLDLVKQRVSTR